MVLEKPIQEKLVPQWSNYRKIVPEEFWGDQMSRPLNLDQRQIEKRGHMKSNKRMKKTQKRKTSTALPENQLQLSSRQNNPIQMTQADLRRDSRLEATLHETIT